MTNVLKFNGTQRDGNFHDYVDTQVRVGEEILNRLTKEEKTAIHFYLFGVIQKEVRIGLGISDLSKHEIERYSALNGVPLFEMIDVLYKEAMDTEGE